MRGFGAVQRDERQTVSPGAIRGPPSERAVPERQRDRDQNRREPGVEAEELHARVARHEHERERRCRRRGARGRGRGRWRETSRVEWVAWVRWVTHATYQALPKPLVDFRPVHDVPPGVDVVGPAVLVLQVVRVLPHVDAEDRPSCLPSAGCPGSACSRSTSLPPLIDQPRPAAAEAADAGLLQLLP